MRRILLAITFFLTLAIVSATPALAHCLEPNVIRTYYTHGYCGSCGPDDFHAKYYKVQVNYHLHSGHVCSTNYYYQYCDVPRHCGGTHYIEDCEIPEGLTFIEALDYLVENDALLFISQIEELAEQYGIEFTEVSGPDDDDPAIGDPH